jgi:hypothetical protein
LKYEIGKLESILVELQVVGQSNPALPELSEILKQETERIKLAWRDEVFSSSNENTVELYIQRHQIAIIELKDQILKLLNPEQTEELLKPTEITDKISALKVLYQSLYNLLSFIEKYFTKYFDLSAKVPDSYRNISERNFSERLPVLREKLKQKELSHDIIWSVTSCFSEFIESKEAKVSYRRIIYLKEMYRELDRLCSLEISGLELERQICTSMIYINFNSLKLLNHCTRVMKESFQSKETLNEQLEVLAHYLKRINQVHEKPGFSYKPSHKSIKSQLTDWVTQEIIFLERRHQLSFGFKTEQQEANTGTEKFKIETSLSVAQTGYFLRILVNAGIIENGNTIELVQFIAKHISSKRAEEVSPGSLRKKFYEIDPATKVAVKKAIIKMLDQTDKP